MSEVGLDLKQPRGHRAQRKRRKGPGCFLGLLLIALLCVAGYLGVSKGLDAVSDWLGPPDDYRGQGSGSAEIEVSDGDSVAEIGRTLKAEGVVASVDAFLGVAQGDERARTIQPGFYRLRQKMSAEWALKELLDKDNRVGRVTIPEGARVDQVAKAIVEQSDISEEQVAAALDAPAKLGLPKAAGDNPEGYLFPSTYQVRPDTDAVDLLRQMVEKSKKVERELRIGPRARSLGISSEEAVVVASIIEYEASREKDLSKVARVVYNRLDAGKALQMDSTVSYVSKREGDPWTTDAERNAESAYNTYKHTGLPPGPIGSPGKKTLEAALNPAAGDWLYFVTTNFETGETKFTDSYSEHRRNVEESKEYCKDSDLC